MSQLTDYHPSWDYPVVNDQSTEDEDQWGDILNDWIENDVDEAVVRKDTRANQPAAGNEGRWYLVTDESPPSLEYDDGTNWVVVNVDTDTDTDTHTDVSEDGATVVSSVGDINATNALNVGDDGDGTVTLSVDETGISHDNIAGVSSGDHHLRYSDEEAQDAVGTILGAQFTYDDATPQITLNQGDGSGLDADTLDGIDDSQFMRSDQADTTTGVVGLAGAGAINGTLGQGSGEFSRAGGTASDVILSHTGGHGRSARTWNAEYDGANGNWASIVGGEPHAQVAMLSGAPGSGVGSGSIVFATAPSNTNAGDAITWNYIEMTEAGNLDMNQQQSVQFVVDKRSADPTSTVNGQMWYRTDLD